MENEQQALKKKYKTHKTNGREQRKRKEEREGEVAETPTPTRQGTQRVF